MKRAMSNEVLYSYKIDMLTYFLFRSEQDKEPEPEAVTEVVGTGVPEESVNDGRTLIHVMLF